ncbi:MAG: 4-alpha-glucanotransferase [Steroidobacteraceae bacterium]
MTHLDTQTLANIAKLYGLGESYYDYRGQLRIFSDAARGAILQAMGATQDAGLNSPPSGLPVVLVRTQDESYCDVILPITDADGSVQLQVRTETGANVSVTHAIRNLQRLDEHRCRLPLPDNLPLGYHHLNVHADGLQAGCALIVAPPRCHEPPAMQQGRRLWGLSIQLYTLRSGRNWGIGDFADLQDLIRVAALQGCATIGLNPLHALRPADAAHISPYSPSHREFLNLLYIAVPEVAEYAQCREAQSLMLKQQAQLQAVRAAACVDYLAVARLKFPALRLLYAEFVRTHLARNTTRAQAFHEYVQQQGDALRLHALYDALDQYFSTQPGHHWGWRSWPVEFHDPQGNAVHVFAEQHAKQVEYFMYLQWLATTQLATAQQLARDNGMSLGLYGDVAVGVDPNGSEVWSNRSLYVDGVAVGAPPDPLALKGQDWGIPPQHPLQLTAQAYQPFVRMLRANMRAAGALRIDHVMTLCRLWWVPRGFEATDGVYVHYPLDDLMKLVALESVRNRCLVIGEDLGTVPDAMRHAMERFSVYHYKVLFFEKARDGQFIAPQDYVRRALAVVTTHDLPPFKSWWQGDDIVLRQQLHLYPDEATRQQVLHERETDRHLLMQALARTGLWNWQPHEPAPQYSPALMRAAYLYAGLSSAALLVVQPEDLLGMTDPVNVPGTSTEHANWQRKLSADLSDMLQSPEVQEMLHAMNKARHGENPNRQGV